MIVGKRLMAAGVIAHPTRWAFIMIHNVAISYWQIRWRNLCQATYDSLFRIDWFPRSSRRRCLACEYGLQYGHFDQLFWFRTSEVQATEGSLHFSRTSESRVTTRTWPPLNRLKNEGSLRNSWKFDFLNIFCEMNFINFECSMLSKLFSSFPDISRHRTKSIFFGSLYGLVRRLLTGEINCAY